MLKKFPLVLLALAAFASVSVHAQTRGPAPALSSIRIYAVGSPSCNWEIISTGAFSTTCNHGGGQIQVAVLEIGYGSTYPLVKMSGNTLPSSARYSRTPVCGTASNYTFTCSAGQIVIGFLNEYNLGSSYQSGLFTYQNNSINGGGTFYARINIL
ncbi:MAG: YolA family protein [Azoarcus sp.]|jgi:hypothetical protein|nr:YolA family protein [Azoarcus sp.]